MAQSFDSLGQFHERAKPRQAADTAVNRIADLVRLEITFPGVRLELLDPERQPFGFRLDIENHGLDQLALFQDL